MLDWNDRGSRGSCLIRDRGSRLIGAHGSRLIEARGYGSCLIGAKQLGRSVLVTEIGACACDRDGVDRSL